MLNQKPGNKIIQILIALVWLINGLLCKILNLVPRHQQIVERILQVEDGRFLTLLIGISEVLMAIWILSGIRRRLNTIFQVLIIATMNTLEFILAPDLLLWKQFNALFAFLFICFLLINEFLLSKKRSIS